MRNIFSLIFLLLLCINNIGCTTIYGKEWTRTFYTTDLVKVSGGENKESVVKKLGGICTPIALEVQDGHKFEVLEFNEKPSYAGRVNKAYWTPYWVYFMDDKLVKYERATQQALIEHTKMIQEVEAMAATMDAFKGTALMPYQHKVDVNSNVNVQGNVDVNVRNY